MKRALLLSAFVVTGCASGQVSPTSLATEKVGQTPPLGTHVTTPVGGVVFSQFRYWSRPGYKIEDPVSVQYGIGHVAVARGEALVPSTMDGKPVLCTARRTYHDPLLGPHRSTCFVGPAVPGTLTRIAAVPGVVWTERDLPHPVRYSPSEQFLPRPDAFKHELLYQGVSGKTIRLSYREFLTDLEQPATHEDLSYDVSSMPALLTFKAVRIEVHAADDKALTYRVLSGF